MGITMNLYITLGSGHSNKPHGNQKKKKQKQKHKEDTENKKRKESKNVAIKKSTKHKGIQQERNRGTK